MTSPPNPLLLDTPVVPPRPRRRWPLRLGVVSLILIGAQVLAWLGAFSPLLSPAVYPALAPAGWHNMTPHGKLVLFSYAASMDETGLAAACGSLFTVTVTNPSTWIFGHMHLWLSHDGGATWTLSDPPFGTIGDCQLDFPVGGHGTLVATISPNDSTAHGPVTIWISRDQGRTWRSAETVKNTESPAAGDVIVPWMYRGGVVYGLHAYPQSPAMTSPVRSEDNGRTWSALPGSGNGDQIVEDYVPDYRQDQAWYRVLAPANQPPLLLHSSNDGATWTVAGSMPASESLAIETSPLAPGHLCAATTTESESNIKMMVSADGGETWRIGHVPATLPAATTAEAFGDALLDRQGNCYLGVHLVNGNGSAATSRYIFLQQTATDGDIHVIPVSNSVNQLGPRLIVPDAHGARLIFESVQQGAGSWAYVLAGAAAETNDTVLIWRSVP